MKSAAPILALTVLAAVAACTPDGTTESVGGPIAPALARADHYSGWSPATSVELFPGADPSFNTTALEGCPFAARDGRTLFLASNRTGGLGGIDIYVSTRESRDDPWSAPVNLGAPINSTANDFCPTLARDGHTFFFVSARPGGCGGDDIYVTRLRGGGIEQFLEGKATFESPTNLGCQVNSAGNEASPFPIQQPGAGYTLFFSSNRAGGLSAEPAGAVTGDLDLYMSESAGGPDGPFGPARLVPGVNSAANDGQPNVSRDAREIFFFSNRPGALGNDIYTATRVNPTGAWSTPVNLGPNVNSAQSETRPSLSWDGTMLYFGSTRPGEGDSDIYVTTRARLSGSD